MSRLHSAVRVISRAGADRNRAAAAFCCRRVCWAIKRFSVLLLVYSVAGFGLFVQDVLGREGLVAGRKIVYGEAWGKSAASPVYSQFHDWAEQYVAATDSSSDTVAIATGRRLAEQRRVALADLIKSNPAAAIANAVPVRIARKLPSEIVAQLETRVSGIGDFSVLASFGNTANPTLSVTRFVRLGNVHFHAYVYGRRLGETTKRGIPLHGIVVDGALALHESAIRQLEGDENAVTSSPGSSYSQGNSTGDVLAEVGGITYRLKSSDEMSDVEARIDAGEATLGPSPMQTITEIMSTTGKPVSQSQIKAATQTWTTGSKNLLVIRVDFSDLPGAPQGYSPEFIQNLNDTQISPFYQRSSYGATSLTTAVTTLVYRMPNPSSSYTWDPYKLDADAEAAAAADYNVGSYDRICIFSAYINNGYAGQGEGGGKFWIYGYYNFGVVTHELGHTYGLPHANLWQVTDANPISASGHYGGGDAYDAMGSNANQPGVDFNPWFKNQLGWIADNQVQTVTTAGTYRINSFDNAGASGILALKIVKDSTHNYWIAARRSFTNNASMSNGAYMMWGFNYNTDSYLLDMTTPGTNDQDAALAVGASFVDQDANITIKPVAEGGIAPNQYLDVEVTMPGATPLETESLTVGKVSGAPHFIINDANLSAGAGTQLNATAAGQYVTYTVPVTSPGTYKVRVGVKTGPKKGIFQLSIDGVNQGRAINEYSAGIGYSVRDVGLVTMMSGGNKAFRFLVTGKNANSGGYLVSFDYIELVSWPTLFEIEGLTVQAKSAATYAVAADANTSGGAFGFLKGGAVGDFVTYTLPVPAPGTYDVQVRVKTAPSRGIFQLSVDGVDQGPAEDEYASIVGYEVRDLGPITFASGGDKAFKFRVSGRNAGSTNYSLGFDYINLVPPTSHYEAEALTLQAKSAATYGIVHDISASSGTVAFLKATGPGDFLTYILPVAHPGTYTVKVGIKTRSDKGIFQLGIDGKNQGAPQDEYSSQISYPIRNLGTVTFTSAGNKAFQFTVVGHNLSSSGYELSFDYIDLVP